MENPLTTIFRAREAWILVEVLVLSPMQEHAKRVASSRQRAWLTEPYIHGRTSRVDFSHHHDLCGLLLKVALIDTYRVRPQSQLSALVAEVTKTEPKAVRDRHFNIIDCYLIRIICISPGVRCGLVRWRTL
jgi:hypothetical protein